MRRRKRPTDTNEQKPQILKQKFVFDYFLNRCIIVAIGNGNFKMARKRIALSVDPEYHELLTRLAEYQKKTVTSIVTDFLEASRPAAEAMLVAFQELEKGVDQNEILKNLLASGLEGAAKNLRD